MQFGKTKERNNLKDLTPNVHILAVLDENNRCIQFINYVKSLSNKKILGNIYKPKINTLHASENTQDIEKNRVIARIQEGKLDILKKITEKLNKTDQERLIKNRYAILLTKPTIKTAKETLLELKFRIKSTFNR
jgi:hypothetical protein